MPDAAQAHKELKDQPELYGVADTRATDAWAAMLKRYPAHIFATLTFRLTRRVTDKYTRATIEIPRIGAGGGMHPEAADKAFKFFVSSINRELYGANWGKRWHGGIQWARGQEFHKDGRLHFHALLSSPANDLNQLISRYKWHEFWFREFGRNQLEFPESQQDVANYVSKYVTKGGEIDFSKNFGAWIPPVPHRFQSSPQQSDLVGPRSSNDHARTDASIASRRAQNEGSASALSLA